MALGFGGNVARLSATLTLDDDGFMKGMAEASTKLDAYNAKLKEEGVGRRFATMASRDYAKQLYDEARGVDQANQSHGRLIRTLDSAQRHWKLLGATTVGVTAGVIQMTGAFGGLSGIVSSLSGVALPAMGAALAGILSPFTSLAAVVAGLLGPLSALVTLFGAVGAGAGFGLITALTSGNKAFNDLQNRVGNMKGMFHDLGNELGQRFLPWINAGVTTIEKFITYADKLAHMSLPDVIHSISTQGMDMLKRINRGIYDAIGKPILEIFSASFGKAGNRISGAFAQILDVWKPLVGKMWGVFTSWFDRQHFTQVGADWAATMANTAVPAIARGLLNAVEADFSNQGFWGKVGMIAGAAFAANFVTGGLVNKLALALGGGALAGGKSLIGRLIGSGAAAGGGVVAGEGVAGGAAAPGGGTSVVGLLGASGIAAIVGVAVPAALVYLSSRQSASSQTKFGNTPGITPRGPGSPGFLPDNLRSSADADTKALNRVAAAEKNLNQYISDGGKSVRGWQLAVERATRQAGTAQSAIHDMGQKGIISADQAAQQGKANLQNYVSQEDAIARKATAASQNTAKFGATTRAQYAHVAALARTSAQLASAIDSIPSSKYISLVLSITENLKSQGNAPGQTPTGIHQTGAYIGGAGSGDIIHAMLEPGEGVINKRAVAALGGKPAIDAINSAVPRFAAGGVVAPKLPTTVLNAPSHFKAPAWYHPDKYYKHRVAGGRDALRKQKHLLAELKKRKAPAAEIKVVEGNIKRIEHGIASDTAGNQNNGPRLRQWIENRVGAIQGTMEFREQTWDTQYQQTGASSWFDKEQSQRLQEVKLFKVAGAWAAKHGFSGDATNWNRLAVSTYQDYKGAKAAATGASAAMSAAQIASFLSTQQGFLSEFAGNIILPGAAAVLSGGINPGGGAGGGASGSAAAAGGRIVSGQLPVAKGGGVGGVTIHNHFTQTPPDSFVHIQKAKLQAAAAFG